MQIAEAFVAIRPKVSPAEFQRDAESQITSAASKAGTSGGQALGKSLTTESTKGARTAGQKAGAELSQGLERSSRGTATRLGAIFGSIGAGLFLKSSFDETRQAITSQAQLTAVLKATGGAAGVTEQHVDQLAATLQKMNAIDDDVTKHQAALLLSFRHVRNEAGQGNDVFDRTLKASQDLAALFGGDLQGALVQLGKAVENPATGLVALQRSGVTFTKSQRDLIKSLVDSNRLLDAQKVILNEVEKQFGGTAAQIAKDDPFKAAGVAFGNFKEQLGRDLLPSVTPVLNVAGKLFELFGDLPGPIRETASSLLVFGAGSAALVRITNNFEGLREIFFGARGALAALRSEEGLAITSTAGLSVAVAGLATGIGLGVQGAQALISVFEGSRPALDGAAKGFQNLANSGELSGSALDLVGANASQLARDLKVLDQSNLKRVFSGNTGAAIRAKADIKEVNNALKQLLQTEGVDVAARAYSELVQQLRALGLTDPEIASRLHPFITALDDSTHAAQDTGAAVDTLQGKLQKLFGTSDKPSKLSQKLGVEDALASAADAQQTLNDARLDAIGLGPKSAQAAEEEASAAKSLADAQRGARDASEQLADAQRGLADAQAKLAEFDNPVSQTIRSLERENIVRRVVTTPEEGRQKQIDLLRFDQENADKRADLQKGVEDAQRRVADAEQSVADAALKVRDAQGQVAEAAKKRRDVQVQAAKDVEEAERKATEQLISAGQALAAFAKNADPKTLQPFLNELLLLAALVDPSGKLAAGLSSIASGISAVSNAGTPKTGTFKPTPEQLQVFNSIPDGPISDKDAKRLHDVGWPGFALGGVVPGPRGKAIPAIVHGGEEVLTVEQRRALAAQRAQNGDTISVEQHNHYHGERPTREDAEFNNRQLGWMIARRSRRA